MRLIVLGSNSLGNCYILENKNEALIIAVSYTHLRAHETL